MTSSGSGAALTAKQARFASISTDAASSGTLNFKIVVDGLSVHVRRDAGVPCDYKTGGTSAVTERLEEVLGYFGYASPNMCNDNLGGGTGLEGPAPGGVIWQTALSGVFPNPFLAGTFGRIRVVVHMDGRGITDERAIYYRYTGLMSGQRGDTKTAIAQGVAAIPLVGPTLSQIGTEIADGRYGAALGDVGANYVLFLSSSSGAEQLVARVANFSTPGC
jgi:hypothetical protein